MKRLKENLWAKLIACFMCMIMGLVLVYSIFTTGLAFETGLIGSQKPTKSEYMNVVQNNMASMYIYNHGEFDNENIGYQIMDKDGKVIEKLHMDKIDKDKAIVGTTYYDDGKHTNAKARVYFNSIEDTGSTYLTGTYYLYKFVYDGLYLNQILLIVSAVMLVLLLIFMVSSAGHQKDGTIKLGRLDKVPLDLLTLADVLLVSGGMALALVTIIDFEDINFKFAITSSLIFYLLSMSVVANYIMSFATRVKLGKWWRNTVTYKVLRIVYKLWIKVWKKVKAFLVQIPSVWKWAAFAGFFVMLELIWTGLTTTYVGPLSLICFVLGCVLCLVFLKCILEVKSIKEETSKLAEGKLNKEIDVDKYHGDIKEIAENLGDINTGMTKAVDEKMKSERFKTELITNVSHDIKTPLTSIINYTDLLDKAQIENEEAKGYIEVLNRQSLRLKKLIEDLIEASKAASGVLTINKSALNVATLVNQTIGEYGEKLEKNNLEVVTNIEDENLYIDADGRRMWRVFENIMNNICKYAQPNTRVYVDINSIDGKTQMIFKDVSKYKLNITGEELMERFVRGDRSRHTEGSGLGLSIAKNLVELQDGQMEIDIDGDLFKVIITFEEYKS